MGMSSQEAVQAAVHSLLAGDSELGGMVSGVFDFVPAKTAYPYVVIADLRSADASTMTERVERVELAAHVFSRARGSGEAGSVLARVQELLHGASLEMEEFDCIDMRATGADVRLTRDGLTYHGKMRFAALVQQKEEADGGE